MIYLDLVFLLNFVYDFLLLVTTGVALKRIFSLKKVVAGAFIGALSMLLLFIDFNNIILFILKILVSILMIFITFGRRNILTNMVYLYMNSVILAGFLYYLTLEFSYNRVKLISYFNSFSVNYVLILIIAPVILFIYFKQTKFLKEKINLNRKVKIIFKSGEELLLNGFIDSGNKLKDPFSKKYIIIVNKNIHNFLDNPIYVPFHGVNKKGLIKCFKINCIEIDGKRFKNYLVGVSDKKINLEGSECILNYKLMEDLNV